MMNTEEARQANTDEKIQLGNDSSDIHRFHADFWEDKVYIGKRCFLTGQSIVELLNCNDVVLFETRVGLDEIRALVDELEHGFLLEEDVKAAKDALIERCRAVKKYRRSAIWIMTDMKNMPLSFVSRICKFGT